MRKAISAILLAIATIFFCSVSAQKDAIGEIYYGAYVNFTFDVDLHDNATEQLYTTKENGIYGINSPIRNTAGVLIHGHNGLDDFGCTFNYTQSPNFPPTSPKWVAFVSRGGCTFTEKINNARVYGADAIIVYDKVNTQKTIMQHKDATEIVALIVEHPTGRQVLDLITRNFVVQATIVRGIAHQRVETFPPLHTASIIFVSVSFLILMLVSLAWLIFYYIQRFRALQARTVCRNRRNETAKKALKLLKVRTVCHGDALLNKDYTCAICIEQYGLNECIRELPCKHSFHQACVDPWLIAKLTCPMCKTLITSEDSGPAIPAATSPVTIGGHMYEEVDAADHNTGDSSLPSTSSSLEPSPSFNSGQHRRPSNVNKNVTVAV